MSKNGLLVKEDVVNSSSESMSFEGSPSEHEQASFENATEDYIPPATKKSNTVDKQNALLTFQTLKTVVQKNNFTDEQLDDDQGQWEDEENGRGKLIRENK